MQLLIANRDHRDYQRGDILAIVPDIHAWSALEVMSMWLAGEAAAIAAGLPVEYQAPFIRNTVNFPNPQFAVCRFPSYRCDLNLAEPWLGTDGSGTIQIGRRLWYLDLDALPPGQRNSLEAAGGEGTLGANRLSAIRNRHDGLSITDIPGWDSDLTQGNSRHRHSGTGARDRLGVL